jgi:hypothetical protein
MLPTQVRTTLDSRLAEVDPEPLVDTEMARIRR